MGAAQILQIEIEIHIAIAGEKLAQSNGMHADGLGNPGKGQLFGKVTIHIFQRGSQGVFQGFASLLKAAVLLDPMAQRGKDCLGGKIVGRVFCVGKQFFRQGHAGI